MKKSVKVALAATLVCFSSTLYAKETGVPDSFLKDTTFKLFKDEVVDNFAWGVENAKGIALGGFDATTYNFNVGAGARLGNFWISAYDIGTFRADNKKTESVTNDAVAKDGVNIDYVDVTKDTKKERASANAINNDLYLSFATNKIGIQGYWKLRDTTPNGEYGKHSEYEEDHAAGTTYSKETDTSKNATTNNFGANFHGIGTAELTKLKLYFQLNSFDFYWYNYSTGSKYNETYKQNSVAYETTDYSNAYSNNTFRPTVNGELGFALPSFGALSTRFVLEDEVAVQFGFRKEETVNTTVNDSFNQKTTTKTTTTDDYGASKFYIGNKLNPQLIFDFDVGERLSIKAKAEASYSFTKYGTDGSNVRTAVTETTTYNKINKTTTKSYSKAVTLPNNLSQESSVISNSLSANTALGVVYQVKPEKFNLNLGVQWSPVSMIWNTTTKKNTSFEESNYTEVTNAAGTKIVTQDSVSLVTQDGTDAGGVAETKTTEFNSFAASAPELKLGATWFVTDKAQLDMAYTSAFNNISIMGAGNGLLTQNFKLMFTVRF